MKKSPRSTWSAGLVILILSFTLGCTKPATPSTILYHVMKIAATPGTDPVRLIELWKMTSDGKNNLQLVSSGWFGEYSPDNSKIAYSEFYAAGIWVANADGTNPVRLTSFGSAPSWSPDGKQLVFDDGGNVGAARFLWIINADGTDAHQLSTVPGSFGHWSPKGDKIIFHGEVNNGIWLIDPDGSHETLLYKLGGYPAWSPDGEQIAYVELTEWCIWVMDADGSNQRKLTDNHGNQPSWSADGSQLAYEVEGKEDTNGIWVINADGSGAHRITTEGRHPTWSK